MISSVKDDADPACLAARLADGPKLFAPFEAERRLEDWLSDLTPQQSDEIRTLAGTFPHVKAILLGIAESSPYLFDLMRSDPERTLCLLRSDPESHLGRLIADIWEAAEAADEAEAMRRLRRGKMAAALLIALCDIGGVWPVMQITAGLTDIAVAAVQSALRFLLRQETGRGRLNPPEIDHPEDASGLVVLAMGKMGAGELNYSSDIDLIVFFAGSRRSLFSCASRRDLRACCNKGPETATFSGLICACGRIPRRRRSRSRPPRHSTTTSGKDGPGSAPP